MLLDYGFLRGAEQEFDELVARYIRLDPEEANRSLDAIEAQLTLIREFPGIGSPHLHGTRRSLVSRSPFQIIYRGRSGLIEIIAISHTSRRPGYWRDRL